MKKYLVILVALAMVLGLSGMAMAVVEGDPTAPGISEAVTVEATVGKYCKLTVVGPGKLIFAGKAGEIQKAEDGSIEKDCNTDTTLVAEVTKDLTHVGGYKIIATETDIDGVYGRKVTVVNTYNQLVHKHMLSVRGTLGLNISSQPAGEYSGEITVTVSTP